jgi:hypothetical protein
VSAFLTDIGTKLADRWLNALLPGLLWAALLAAAIDLGQDHPFDAARLSAGLDHLATRPAAHTPGTILLAAAAILLACAGVGLLAAATGNAIQYLWVLPGDLPPAAWLRRRRQKRWDTATSRLKTAILHAAAPARENVSPSRAAARVRARQRRRARLGPARPHRPTRIADRFEGTTARTSAVNGLDDLSLAWPRLFAVLPDTLRADITAARDAYSATARLAAWSLLYTALAFAWWPAALLGPAIAVSAVSRARTAAAELADLIETAADLHLADLASRLGIPAISTPVETGHAITTRLRATAPMAES